MLSIRLAISCKKTKPSWLQTHRDSRIIKIIRGTRRGEGGRGGVREGGEGEEVDGKKKELLWVLPPPTPLSARADPHRMRPVWGPTIKATPERVLCCT